MEQQILAAFIKDRGSYDRLIPFVERDDFDGVARLLLAGIEEYYERDNDANEIDISVLSSSVCRKHPRFEQDIERVLSSIQSSSVSNTEHEFLAHKRAVVGHKLATLLHTDADQEEVAELMDKYRMYSESEVLSKAEEGEFTGDVDVLFKAIDRNLNREFHLRPPPLQVATGGAGRGDHILIFGRPNSGKTLVTINLVAGFLRDGHTVLYIGNEDSMDRMLFRFICRLSNKDMVDVEADRKAAVEKARGVGLNNLVFRAMAPGTFREIDSLAKKYKPDVIVIDQIRNLHVRGTDGLTAKLEIASIEARNLAKRHNCLAVSITQAGDSAKNKLILTMEDIDSSKTGIQAALDCMIGVGNNDAYTAAGRRMINVRKNKLGGDDSEFPVGIDIRRSKVVRA